MARDGSSRTWRSPRFSGMVLLAFNTKDGWRLGLLDSLDQSNNSIASRAGHCFNLAVPSMLQIDILTCSADLARISPFCRSCCSADLVGIKSAHAPAKICHSGPVLIYIHAANLTAVLVVPMIGLRESISFPVNSSFLIFMISKIIADRLFVI